MLAGTDMLTTGIMVARLIVGVLLIVAGWLKLHAGTTWFLHRVLDFDVPNSAPTRLFARTLPWLEIALGILLIFGFFKPWNTLVTFVLLYIFTLAILSHYEKGF